MIKRLQGDPAEKPPEGANRDLAITEASSALTQAWICALNIYGKMHKYAIDPSLRVIPDKQAEVRHGGRLLGLSVGKTGTGAQPAVNDGDLAGAEHRVGRLGVLIGCVNKAVDALKLRNAALTSDAILREVVTMAGDLGPAGLIRKTSNPDKTVEMIKTLAVLSHNNATLTENQKWDAVRAFNIRRF